MRRFLLAGILLSGAATYAQQNTSGKSPNQNTENIYTIKQQFLQQVLHNPNDVGNDFDNELEHFNRWFNDVEQRCYPSGNLPRPDVLLTAIQEAKKKANKGAARTTTGAAIWHAVGPNKVPSDHNGIGRINCIVVSPQDTNTLYVGTACGGVHISHDGGATWVSNTDQFPSLSIADIAVNPLHPDTIYAATGDGFGYETGPYSIFWGGLYSAGVMKSTDGGASWGTTGLSYLQSNKDMIQKLLIHPTRPNILLAATRNGTYRTTNSGITWTMVDPGHVFSMAFKPDQPDTVYAVNTSDLRVSYNAGATWQPLFPSINLGGSRATIAVSPCAPGAIWILNTNNDIRWSHNGGVTFFTTNPPDTADFYGYYDRILAVSPVDSEVLYAFGKIMSFSNNGGFNWDKLNPTYDVHVDNHAIAFNPLNGSTMYCGNDGGISVSRNRGATWQNLGDGLMISQIYRIATSHDDPNVMIAGLQDNGTFAYNGTAWHHPTGGDGEDCDIHPGNDYLQISASQNGNFYLSVDRGASFSFMHVPTSGSAAWTAPVIFDGTSTTIYYGMKDIYASYDEGGSFTNLTNSLPFSDGATNLVLAPSDNQVLYTSNLGKMLRTINGGTTWTDVTGNLPIATVGITRIAVDPRDAMRVFATTSGYSAGKKVYMSTTGGTTWTNISADLPNLPANCIAIDSSTPGAIFVGTDIGVYYTDSSQTGWTLYGTGLPNVMIYDLDINYVNYKLRVGTYGRGIWEVRLKKDAPSAVPGVSKTGTPSIRVFPNPTRNNWKIMFPKQKPANFSVKVTDMTGRIIYMGENTDLIDASRYAGGIYNLDVTVGDEHYTIKAVKN